MSHPRRGDVWYVDFDPIRRHEQGGRRPALVVSADALNRSAARVVIVVPMTSREKRVCSHVEIPAGQGGLPQRSFVKCEDIRSVSIQRMGRRLGAVSNSTLELVDSVLRDLLQL